MLPMDDPARGRTSRSSVPLVTKHYPGGLPPPPPALPPLAGSPTFMVLIAILVGALVLVPLLLH